MNMPGEQSKVIKIRVSEEEFQALNDVCQQKGMGNIGELIRDELSHLVNTYESAILKGADTHLWLLELVRRLSSLQSEVERLEELLKVQR